MHHFHYKGGVLHAEDVSIARLAAEYEVNGIKLKDARHLARAVLHEAIRYFVSSDEALVKKARTLALVKKPRTLGLTSKLTIVTALEAERLLDIQPGEEPPIRPLDSSPLAASPRWWIPS